MESALSLRSFSRSSDAAYLASADIAALADHLDIDYRLVGGHAVTLLVAAHGVTARVPERETADADFGASYPVIADRRLLPALRTMGYSQAASNRFTRRRSVDESGLAAEPLELVIDVLAPSYQGRLLTNQVHGDLVVDEVPGLVMALARPGHTVDVQVTLMSGALLRVRLTVPDVVSAICLKTYAYVGRFAERDAIDVWRLLEAASAAGVGPTAWGVGGSQRDALSVLHQYFGSAAASGTRQATKHLQSRTRIAALVTRVAGPPLSMRGAS